MRYVSKSQLKGGETYLNLLAPTRMAEAMYYDDYANLSNEDIDMLEDFLARNKLSGIPPAKISSADGIKTAQHVFAQYGLGKEECCVVSWLVLDK